MKIRQEKPAEYQAVERLTYQAFKELNLTENWRPTEHFIVHLLRESADFIPELSLVSETDQGKLTGHIMSSKAKLRLPDHTEKAVLTVGPLSVHPEAQNTGVGSALIKHSVQKAKELGIGGLIILGHPTYYTKFGFVPATTFQITLPEKNIRSIIGFGITARLFWHKWWGVAFFNMLCLSRNTPCRIRSL